MLPYKLRNAQINDGQVAIKEVKEKNIGIELQGDK